MKTVGEILKECIKKNGHTLEEEAKAIGVSQSLLSDVINGKREIRSESLRRICNHFNISADYLLGLSPNPKIDADLDMICDYTGLSLEVIEKLHNDDFQPITIDDEESDVYSVSEEGKLLIDVEEYHKIRYRKQRSNSYKEHILNNLLLSREFDTILEYLYNLKLYGTFMKEKYDLLKNGLLDAETLKKEMGFEDFHDFLYEVKTMIQERHMCRYESAENINAISKKFSVLSEEEVQDFIALIRLELKREMDEFNAKQNKKQQELQEEMEELIKKYGNISEEDVDNAEEE